MRAAYEYSYFVRTVRTVDASPLDDLPCLPRPYQWVQARTQALSSRPAKFTPSPLLPHAVVVFHAGHHPSSPNKKPRHKGGGPDELPSFGSSPLQQSYANHFAGQKYVAAVRTPVLLYSYGIRPERTLVCTRCAHTFSPTTKTLGWSSRVVLVVVVVPKSDPHGGIGLFNSAIPRASSTAFLHGSSRHRDILSRGEERFPLVGDLFV